MAFEMPLKALSSINNQLPNQPKPLLLTSTVVSTNLSHSPTFYSLTILFNLPSK